MAKVTFNFGEKNFEAIIALTDQELSELKWILLNARSLMKSYDVDNKENRHKVDCINIKKFLEAIKNHSNQFEDPNK